MVLKAGGGQAGEASAPTAAPAYTYTGGGLDLKSIPGFGQGVPGGGGTRIGQGSYSGTAQVFWGAQTRGEAFHDYTGNSTRTLDEALVAFTSFPEAEQKSIANKLYRAGILQSPDDMYGAYDEWQKAVSFAAEQYTFGKKEITPWDVLQTRSGINRGSKNANKTRTTTSTAAQVLSNGDADAMVKAIYQQQLGRDPDKGELSRYRSMLINKVRDSPQTTRTTTKYDAEGNPVSSNSVQSGGLDAQGQANFLSTEQQADPEWGAYQAATKYYNLLSSALAAPGGV